jgi:fatty acid desaturase
MMDHLRNIGNELKAMLLENQGKALILYLTLLLLAIVFIILAPLLTIWSLNTLGMAIPLNFGTWCAVFWLLAVLKSGQKKS